MSVSTENLELINSLAHKHHLEYLKEQKIKARKKEYARGTKRSRKNGKSSK